MGLKIGDGIVPFKLTAVDGKEYSDGFFRKKLLLVVFTCNHCPYAEAYEERIKQIQEEFEDELDVVGINSNDDVGYPEDSFEKMIERARDAEFNFYYLRDDSQKVAHAFGALVTPDCFLFDSDSVLQYRGRIDDNWKHAADVCCENLKDAIKALLTGMEVPEPETQGIGCSIKWK